MKIRIIPDELGSDVVNLGFIGTSSRINANLEFIHEKNGPIQNFNEFKLGVAAAIKAGEITSSTVVDEWAKTLLKPLKYASLVDFKHACIYLILAEIAYSKSETEKAWSLLARSCLLCGRAVYSTEDTSTGDKEKQRENARIGGKKRGDRYQPVRQEVVRLLKEQRPPGGWKESLPTRKYLVESLMIFRKGKDSAQRGFMFPGNISAALLRWFTDNDEIRDAYESNCSPLNE